MIVVVSSLFVVVLGASKVVVGCEVGTRKSVVVVDLVVCDVVGGDVS